MQPLGHRRKTVEFWCPATSSTFNETTHVAPWAMREHYRTLADNTGGITGDKVA